MTDRLRSLWAFDDLDATEQRLRAALAEEATADGRAEVLTQLARVEGLRGAFAAGEELIREAETVAGGGTAAAARIDLERGRLRRSGGDRAGALPLFVSAHATAVSGEHWFLAADAAHMAALAAPDRDGMAEWTERGLDLADAHDTAAHWAGPLLNNLGWSLVESGDREQALDAFHRALAARERDPGNPGAIAIARYAVGKALRALDRAAEAIPHLEQAVAWADGEGAPDGWFHEELAEEYEAVGRSHEATSHARLALPLLEEADPAFASDADRAARLRRLAAGDGDA